MVDKTAKLTMLEMLKVDLGITTHAYDERLCQYLDTAAERITAEGARLDVSRALGDKNLVIMYAAWMWRKRDTMEGMPRMLRWALNNAVFGGKLEAEKNGEG